MIKIFNSAYPESNHRMLDIRDVSVEVMQLNTYGEPILIFSHKDYPLGPLYAEFVNGVWHCDMD